MADPAEDFLAALNNALPPGVRLEFADGDLWVSARDEKDLHAFLAAHGDTLDGLRALLKGAPPPAQPPALDAGGNGDALKQWRRMGDGAGELMEKLAGGPPPAVPVAQVTAATVQPPPEQRHLPDPPRTDSGYPYIDGEGFAWKARRDLARSRGEVFNELPPYNWSFG
jgi:hypothetical protein